MVLGVMGPIAEQSRTVGPVAVAYFFARDVKATGVWMCIKYAHSLTLEIMGRSGGVPLLVERAGNRLRGDTAVWMCCVWARGRVCMRGYNWALLGTATKVRVRPSWLVQAGRGGEVVVLMRPPPPPEEGGGGMRR